jgi:hypothetical protein
LARDETLRQVLENLYEHHISIIGPRHYGKTVFATALAAAARASGRFSDIVFWDLRHFTPENDAEFFATLAGVLCEQVTSQGDATKGHFKPDVCTYSGIKGFFEYLNGIGMRILVVLDGMDQPLDCAGLTKNLWDNLAGFAKVGSLNLLATSRRPLRQLCKSATGRASDFWERFEDPPTRLKALTRADLGVLLRSLAEAHGGLEKGVESGFANATGGIPRLAVCLARRLYEDAKTPVTLADVRRAAAWVLAEHGTALEAAWDVCSTEEQTAYADLVARGGIEAREAGRLARALVPLGLAETDGSKMRPTCTLLRDFTAGLQSGLVSLKVLFGDPAAYDRHILHVVRWRLSHLTIKDEALRDFVHDAVERVGKPKLFFKEIRSIVDQALTLIWTFECPDRHSPRYESARDAHKAEELKLGDSGNLLRHLLYSTDPRNKIILKRANRKMYSLLSALQGYGDLGQHQGNEVLAPALAAAACPTVVELAAELARQDSDGNLAPILHAVRWLPRRKLRKSMHAR